MQHRGGARLRGIGGLNESSLHAALKSWYGRPGDLFEQPVEGFVVDIVRSAGATGDMPLLIEIQTGNFIAIRGKLGRLLAENRVLLVHPVAHEKWILRWTADDAPIGRRKSPKRGRVEDLFRELVRMPGLVAHPNLSLEVVLIREEDILRDDGAGSWRRRRWSVADRRLLGVVGAVRFDTPADLAALVPPELPRPFTNHDLALALGCPIGLAQKMTYSLVRMGMLVEAGKRGHVRLFEAVSEGSRNS